MSQTQWRWQHGSTLGKIKSNQQILSHLLKQFYNYIIIIIIIASRRWLKQHNFAIFKTLLGKNFYRLIFRREIIYNLFSLFRESLSIWLLCFQMMAQAGKQKTAYTSTEEENSVEISKENFQQQLRIKTYYLVS